MSYAYPVEIEVAGPLAMFARPDTGGVPTSYPVPTWSACKGIFECIAFFADGAAWISPASVEVCRRVGDAGGRVQYQRYTTNYGGPLRKASLYAKGTLSGGSSMQLFATVLVNVCYRIRGEAVGPKRAGKANARHHLQDLFNRRLKQGRCHRAVALGWKEFTADYVGPYRDGVTEVDTALNTEIPSMLTTVWDGPVGGKYSPRFDQSLVVKNGVLEFPMSRLWRASEERAHVE